MMFIATYNAIYAVGDDGNSEPTAVYEGTDHQGLGGRHPDGAMVSLSNGQAVVSALSDGMLLVLSEDGGETNSNRYRGSNRFVARCSRKSVDAAHWNG